VAEMKYQPVACCRGYRLIIVRKNLTVSEPKQGRLFDDYRYLFYITNDWQSTPAEIVFGANDRCNQENVWAQLKEARAFHAPLNTLLSNWAYMLIAAQAWNLKAWLALSLPAPQGPQCEQREQERTGLLRMEFRTFVNAAVSYGRRPARQWTPELGCSGPPWHLSKKAILDDRTKTRTPSWRPRRPVAAARPLARAPGPKNPSMFA
jgi:hypothetical protein